MLGEGQEDLELGPGTWASQVGQEQGEGVQAVGGQGLVIQQQVQQVVVCEGDHHVTHGSGQRSLKRLQVPRRFLHIVPLACLLVGVDEGDVFAAEVLHAVIHHAYQGLLLKVLPM